MSKWPPLAFTQSCKCFGQSSITACMVCQSRGLRSKLNNEWFRIIKMKFHHVWSLKPVTGRNKNSRSRDKTERISKIIRNIMHIGHYMEDEPKDVSFQKIIILKNQLQYRYVDLRIWNIKIWNKFLIVVNIPS